MASLDAISVLETSDSDGDGVSSLSFGPNANANARTVAEGRQSRAKNATPRELASIIGLVLGGTTDLLATWLDVEAAALTDEETAAIADPAARILNRQAWGKKAGKYLINGSDYILLTYGITSYSLRIAPLVRAKMGNYAKPVSQPSSPVYTAPAQRDERDERPGSNGHTPIEADVAGGVRYAGFAGFGADAE